MSNCSDALWLNVSPALKGFDRPLFRYLTNYGSIAQWEYVQAEDEPMSFEIALTLLHDDLKHNDRPIHLLGHSTSGLLGLLYARRHPERVRSLTVLSVGVYPAVDWQAHYYAQLQFLPCPRSMLLTQTVYNLFGYQSRPIARELVQILEQDLNSSLSPHTLYRRVSLAPGTISPPLLVCGGQNDIVIDPNQLQGWRDWLKPSDRLWQCPSGHYFFHYSQPRQVGRQIFDFWKSCSCRPLAERPEPIGIDY
jgi:pimeloyl-ACP methyl ester carboxylesterase